MGCAQSRVNDDEAVTRCKERRQWMKAAMAARNAFAAAHSAYAASLKDTGAALSEFGQVAAHDSVHSSSSSSSSSSGGRTSATGAPVITAPVQLPAETLLPPPPPLPEFSSSPLHRSISMPDLPKKFPSKIHQAAPILEDDNEGDDEAEEENDGGLNRRRRRPSEVAGGSPSLSPFPAPPPPPQREAWDFFGLTDENMPVPSLNQAGGIRPEREEAPEEKIETSAPPPPVAKHDEMVGGDDEPVTPQKVVVETPLAPKVPRNQKHGGTAHHHHHHTASAPTLEARRGKTVPAAPPSIDLMKVLTDLDDLFLGASESTNEVSKVLEATRMHYHSNFVDSRGTIILFVIFLFRSFDVE
ncbi:hypothetical protein BHM03_00041074 [Ensete ventricosum]|nr:hypothetical protein BHM03_00041074 [Ensete ventricosum]